MLDNRDPVEIADKDSGQLGEGWVLPTTTPVRIPHIAKADSEEQPQHEKTWNTSLQDGWTHGK